MDKVDEPCFGGRTTGQDRDGGRDSFGTLVLFCFPMCSPAQFEPFEFGACVTDLKIKTQPCEFGDLNDSL